MQVLVQRECETCHSLQMASVFLPINQQCRRDESESRHLNGIDKNIKAVEGEWTCAKCGKETKEFALVDASGEIIL